MNAFGRIGVWFACLLLAVSLFSLILGSFSFFSLLVYSPISALRMIFTSTSLLSFVGSSVLIFQATMIFALPVWFLCLPFVAIVKNAEGWRLWATLISGILIGPASLALWGLALQLKGADTRLLWRGDGLDIGVEQCMLYALVVGYLTSIFYVVVLKDIYYRIAR